MALIAVPDNRLVTSELHLSRNVTIGVRVLIHFSPFLMLSAPVLGSTSVFSNVCLENFALQFPCLLIQPLLSFFCFFSSAGMEVQHLWTFDLRIKSSTVFLKFCHQLAVFSQNSHVLQSQSVGYRGTSGKIWVGTLYSLAFIFSWSCSLTSSIVPIINSPTCTLQILHYFLLEIRIWIHNLISNFLWRPWVQNPKKHVQMQSQSSLLFNSSIVCSCLAI